jgi:hypothetical protein
VKVEYGEFVVHVLLKEMERGTLELSTCMERLLQLCNKYSSSSYAYKFCPGLNPAEYESQKEIIRFDLKKVRKTTEPFLRVDSVKCLLWHELGRKASTERREASEVLCPACVRLKSDITYQQKRTEEESPSKKARRQQSSSRARLSYMSPTSQVERKNNQKQLRQTLKRKLDSYEETEVPLNDEQSDEMNFVVSTIESQFQAELETIFDEGDKCGVGHKLRHSWKTDQQRDSINFNHDQVLNKTGNKGNRWSVITIRMALAVYTRSPSAYDALKAFNILQMPSRSTLQAYTGAFLHEPGANSACIEDQVAQFVLHCEQRQSEGKLESKKDGVIVFDEVKVISRLMWNSRSQRVIGLSMTHTQMASMEDIYQSLNGDQAQQTSYILQFLWRDLTSDYDIIGPYFTSPKTMDSKFILSCVLETVKLFHLHGLVTSLIVCDGAATNLCTIKATHGISGAYSINKGASDPYEVCPCMMNPFNPPNFIYWLICPTHQLKNMINALFSSKYGGTKSFMLDGVLFGWPAIVSLYEWECKRVSSGLTRMVPKLKEIHVIRDSWTKLNVAPAKIMQVSLYSIVCIFT